MFFDYADSGAWTERTYRANESDFAKILLRQRVLVDMTDRNLATEMIGEPVSMPVALAPTGFCGMQHADGEILAAQAAEAFGVPFCLSTMSICSIEDVAANTTKPFWFQLYVMRDRGFIERLIDRAKAAELLGAGADPRPADPRPAPQGPAQRPLRPAEVDPEARLAARDPARLVPRGCSAPGATASATSSATPRTSATSPRSPPGPRSSSTRASPGRTSSGSRSGGAAS